MKSLSKQASYLFCLIIILSGLCSGNEIDKANFYIKGIITNETAFRVSNDFDFTKLLTTAQCVATYDINDSIGLLLNGRARYDAVFDLTDQYSRAAEDEYQKELEAREVLIDIKMGNTIVRLGLQHIVWGEAPGVLIADVVNPVDLRESTLLKFSEIRIPLWAVDISRFLGNDHMLEFVWTPISEQNEFPEKGSEFDTLNYNAFGGQLIENPRKDYSKSIKNSGIGLRIAGLYKGWDWSLFYYSALDNNLVYSRNVGIHSTSFYPIITITPISKRVSNFGMTATQSWENFVFKSELVFKKGRYFTPSMESDLDTVTIGDEFSFMCGVDKSFFKTDFNAGLIGFFIMNSNVPKSFLEDDQLDLFYFIRSDKRFAFYGLNFSFKTFFMHEPDEGDYRLSLDLDWFVTDDFQVSLGADFLDGDSDTLFGRYSNKDRVLLSIKYFL